MRTIPLVAALLLAAVFHCIAAETDDADAKVDSDCAALLAAWRKPGASHDQEARQALIEAGVKADQPEAVEEALDDGNIAALEIKLPSDAKKIDAKPLVDLGKMPNIPYSDAVSDYVIRRMTKNSFEVWTPKHGWLFNAKGKLIHEALPPRRDGTGREWHGAFLPDGSWITTDLWEMDKTLSFFSSAGKLVREIKVEKLVPVADNDECSQNLIGWARCDKKGEGWIVSVGDGPGRGRVLVTEDGKFHLLTDVNAPWKLCYPRELEPKGMFTELNRPSDDFQNTINFQEAGHGVWVNYPSYTWSNSKEDGIVVPAGDHNFGFFPESYQVYIGASDYEPDQSGHKKLKTWFFTSPRKCLGWVRAAYIADAVDEKSMCFCDEGNGVDTLGPDLKVQSRVQFTIAGANATPVKLFADLRLGFFFIGKNLILARW